MSDNRYKKIAQNQQIIKKLLSGPLSLKEYARTLSQPVRGFGKIPLIEVDDYLALVRICGYFKYNIGSGILYRGQATLHPNLQPTLFRNNRQTPKQLDKMITALRNSDVIDPNNGAAKSNRQKDLSTEPMLQHYGIETRWIDLVDSIPHALFFAINKYTKSSIKNDCWTFVPSVNEYGYLYLIGTGNVRKAIRRDVNGIWRTETGLTICDLRTAKPSIVLRPHAQHGLLIRGNKGEVDLWSHIISIVRFKVSNARNWIQGDAFTREAMLPNPHQDLAYATLTGAKMGIFKLANPQYDSYLKIPTHDFD